MRFWRNMDPSRGCKRCGKRALVRDDVTGESACSSCGVVQDFDNYDANIGGINGPVGTFVRVGTTGTGTIYSYNQKKTLEAQNQIDQLTYRLGLSGPKSNAVKSMVERVTDGEFGLGNWFPILVGACAYVVMRADNKSLPLAEIAPAVGCDDHHELGRMISRVVAFLDLDLPQFDIVGVFERTLRNSHCLADVGREKMERMLKQGVFLTQCAIKWFLTTGRRPLPVVVAVLVLVAQINEVHARIEDVAGEVYAAPHTCRLRYKEILKSLVAVAQVLPWGKDVTVKNVVKNAPFVIRYMETKAMMEPKRLGFDLNECFDLGDTISECLRRDDGYSVEGYATEPNLLLLHSEAGEPSIVQDSDELRLSHESLSLIYNKFLGEAGVVNVNSSGENERVNGLKRKRGFGIVEYTDWWNGKSELSKKLLLKQVLEKDVGLDPPPPSFVTGCLANKRRRDKIKAARLRIDKIMNPANVVVEDNADLRILGSADARKKRKGKKICEIDWEDLIIETLLLHRVKEEEIEKGHYNSLLGTHVFISGIA